MIYIASALISAIITTSLVIVTLYVLSRRIKARQQCQTGRGKNRVVFKKADELMNKKNEVNKNES